MRQLSPFFTIRNKTQRQVVIFLSGEGTNAEKVLDYWWKDRSELFHRVALFTDRPTSSRARTIADKFNLPLIENDIKRFYLERGSGRVTLATSIGRQIREEWTVAVRKQLKPYDIDFGLFAGFVPLTNITADFPCLNVHPGDLTYLKKGQRYLIGLHTIPIEKAILDGLSYLRSSIIVAQPYNDSEQDMDMGPVLGVSEKIDIDFLGYNLEQLKQVSASRPSVRPQKGYQDALERVAKFNLAKLKHEGDWVIFPQVAHEFSRGHFGLDGDGGLWYKNGSDWIQVNTIVFGKDRKQIII